MKNILIYLSHNSIYIITSPMGTGSAFSGIKRPRREADCVQLCHQSALRLHGVVLS